MRTVGAVVKRVRLSCRRFEFESHPRSLSFDLEFAEQLTVFFKVFLLSGILIDKQSPFCLLMCVTRHIQKVANKMIYIGLA